MAITSAGPKALGHIQDGQIDKAALAQFCNSVTIGPVKINYCIDTAVPQITIDVYVSGTRIGGGTINTSNPTITIGGSVAGFKAEVTLTANFSAKNVTYSITVCVPIFGCTAYSGTLFSW